MVRHDLNIEAGYHEGNTRISFPVNDMFAEKLCHVAREGKYLLWCYGDKDSVEVEFDDAPPVKQRTQ